MKRIIALLLCVLFITGCSPKNEITPLDKTENEVLEPNVKKDEETSLNIALSDLNGLFNPLYEDTMEDSYVNKMMFDTLLELDKNGDISDGLSTYSVNEYLDEYTFILKDAKFSNGSKILAQDVAFTFKILCDPSYMGVYDFTAADIAGFTEYYEGLSENLSGIKILDEKTIKITLNNPNPNFAMNMVVPVISQEYYKKYYSYNNTDGFYEFIEPCTSGAYKFDTYTEGSVLTLTKNDEYYRGIPKIDKINVVYTAIGSEVNAVASGKADMTFVAADKISIEKAKAENLQVTCVDDNSYTFFGFNCKNGIFSNILLRKAVAYAIPREEIIYNVFGQNASVINIPESGASYYYDEEGTEKYEFDMEKAAKILDEAGYLLNEKGIRSKNNEELSMRFVASTQNPVLDVAIPVLNENLTKLGIKVEFESVDMTTLIQKLSAGECDMWFFGLSLSANPMENIGVFTTDNMYNFSLYYNEDLDNLYDNFMFLNSKDEIKNLTKKAFKIVNSELPVFPFYQRKQALIYKNEVKNLNISSYRNPFCDIYTATYEK